jgi:hypothetical protein
VRGFESLVNTGTQLSPSLEALTYGYIVIGMCWSAIVAELSEQHFGAAATWCLIASALTLVGLIHAESAGCVHVARTHASRQSLPPTTCRFVSLTRSTRSRPIRRLQTDVSHPNIHDAHQAWRWSVAYTATAAVLGGFKLIQAKAATWQWLQYLGLELVDTKQVSSPSRSRPIVTRTTL